MKLSTTVLLVTVILVLLITSLFASRVVYKNRYDKVDTSDLYSTSGRIYIFAKYEF